MFRLNKDSDFSKENQKKLKERYAEALHELWKGDKSMVDYGLKSIVYLVPICNGKYIICLHKTNIEKEFSFGYSDLGQGLSYEENNKRIAEIRKNLEEYFIQQNVSGIDNTITQIQNALNDTYKRYIPTHYVSYYNSPENCPIHSFSIVDTLRDYKPYSEEAEHGEISEYDLNKLLLGYSLLKENTIERLKTYLKKYGTSKIRLSSYWIDR